MQTEYTQLDRAGLRSVPLRLTRRVCRDSLLRNSAYIMGTTVSTSLLGYLYWIVAARTYSVYDVGLASALIAAMTMASYLSNLGIGSSLVQTLPRRESGYAWSLTLNAGMVTGILAALLIGSVVAVGLMSFSPQFSLVPNRPAYVAFFALGVALMTASYLLDQTFVAERAAGNMLARNTVFSLLKIPLLVLPILAVVGAFGIVASWVLAAGAAVLLGYFLLRRLGRGHCLAARGMAGQMRGMLSSLAGHHFINLGGIAPMYLLPVLVATQLSASDNAYFYTTWRLGGLFFMVSPAVAASLFAEGSYLGASDLGGKVRSSLLLIGALLVPVMLVFLLGGGYIMAMFGPSYPRHGLLLLMILTVSAIPDAITNVFVSVLRVRRLLPHAAALNVGMALLTLVLAFILLPPLGIAGAGWAWLIAQTAGSLVVLATVIAARRDSRPASLAHGSSPVIGEES